MQRRAGPIMNMKVQGSRSGKALGIGELLASACSTSATLDRSLIHMKEQGSSSGIKTYSNHKNNNYYAG